MKNHKTILLALAILATTFNACKKMDECTVCKNPYGSSVVCPEPNGCEICRSSYGSNDEYQVAVNSYKQGGYDCKVKK